MVRDAAELSGLAEAMIARLRAEGIDPTPAEIVRLNWLAWQVETPGHRLLLSRGIPVEVGGAILWPLTLAGQEWFGHIVEWLPDDEQHLALAYAMAHGRREDCTLPITPADARKAVRAWRGGLRCRTSEIIEAVRQLNADLERDEMPPMAYAAIGAPMSAGDMSAFLSAACGGPPSIWEYGCSVAYCLGMMQAIAAQSAADGEAIAKDARMDANRAFLWAVEKVRQAHGKGTA